MRQGIVGRDDGRRRIGAWLGSGVPGASALVLSGAAGIGRTALWEWTVGVAGGVGAATGVVLVSRASAVDERTVGTALRTLLAAVGPPSAAPSSSPRSPRHQPASSPWRN